MVPSGTTPTASSLDRLAVRAENLGKQYRLFDRPPDRLKEQLLWRFGAWWGRDLWALRGVSFQVSRGERFGVIGRNGSGKSTLLQLLAGLVDPSEGRAFVRGRVAALLELGAGFNPEFTGRENAQLYSAILGLTAREFEERLDDILAFADIGPFIDEPVRTYSSGMLVRLAFAVATSVDADLLLVDEALAVGDTGFRRRCYDRLERLLASGTSVVLVTHSLGEVQEFCDRTLVLDAGRPAFLGNSCDAVREYLRLETRDRGLPALVPPDTGGHAHGWPPRSAFQYRADSNETGDTPLRVVAAGLFDASRRASLVFEQGETMHVYLEVLCVHAVEDPALVVSIEDQRGVAVRAFDARPNPARDGQLEPGSRMNVHASIELGIAAGEHTLTVAMASGPQMQVPLLKLVLVVVHRTQSSTVRLLHHGLVNLPGRAALQVVRPPQSAEPAHSNVDG